MSCYMELKKFRYLAWKEHFGLTWYMLQRGSQQRTIALALGLCRPGSVLELLHLLALYL
ncbi:rCG48802 [Rattus norvegicus]|uniref:RCG48802 n=1 Tax=Rattus norvegicus TaxID=10116 RepID=A6IFW9_RAT|nr:rCG48802 [Rattus norvegicus]